jgi:hypothetical protein
MSQQFPLNLQPQDAKPRSGPRPAGVSDGGGATPRRSTRLLGSGRGAPLRGRTGARRAQCPSPSGSGARHLRGEPYATGGTGARDVTGTAGGRGWEAPFEARRWWESGGNPVGLHGFHVTARNQCIRQNPSRQAITCFPKPERHDLRGDQQHAAANHCEEPT